jgi:uncharacterized protein YacL (UPF0231 family)
MEQQMKIIADAVNEIMRQTLAARDEIEKLRRDVKEANARAYVMAQEVTFWQDRAAPKEKQ